MAAFSMQVNCTFSPWNRFKLRLAILLIKAADWLVDSSSYKLEVK